MKTSYLRSFLLLSLLLVSVFASPNTVQQSLIESVKETQKLKPAVKSKVINGERVLVDSKMIQVMVRIKEGVDAKNAYQSFLNINAIQSSTIQMVKSFSLVGNKAGIKSIDKKHILVLKSNQLTKDELIAKAKQINGAEAVEVDEMIYLSATPNDARYPELWGMHNDGSLGTADADIDAPEAWDSHRGSRNVVVGIIDTGIDYTHVDLVNNMWTNPNEIAGNGIDDDNNGYIDDIHGIDAINDNGDPMDSGSHGTHVAGTIGAEGNNTIGVVGVNWTTSIAACKFLDNGGSTSDAIQCVNYFTDLKLNRGINVVVTNNSWGGGGFSQELHDVIATAGDNGILFAAAAGNSGTDNDANPSYPASYDVDSIIAVAATDSNDNLANFSQYGVTSVDLAAPGVSILSTVPSGGNVNACTPNDDQVFYTEGFEANLSNWDLYTEDTNYPGVDLTSEHFMIDDNESFSGNYSLTDTLAETYNDNRLQTATLKDGFINLSSVPGDEVICASFQVKGTLESNYDYLYLLVSADGGANWETISQLDGTYGDWTEISVKLSSSYFVSDLKIALVRTTDGSVVYSGYNIDNLKISTGSEDVVPPSNSYDSYSGTSMATPHVTGAVALLAAAEPSKSSAELKQIILSSVDILGTLSGVVATGGRLNINNMFVDNNNTPEPVLTNASYIRGASSPWGQSNNEDAMTKVFGEGNWNDLRMADGITPFLEAADQDFIFLEGGDSTANELNTYLQTYRSEIESFVNNGGTLLLNSAPNEGGNIDFGFGGTTLNYPAFAYDVTASDVEHPIFSGPFTPIGTDYHGNQFTLAIVTGDELTPIIIGAVGDEQEGNNALAEKTYGSGRVLFGGMTASYWHNIASSPSAKTKGSSADTEITKDENHIQDEAADNLIANIISYAAGAVSGPEASIDFDDLENADSGLLIPSDYKDLMWSASFYVTESAVGYPNSGYENGTVSTPNVAFNGYEDDVSISSESEFDFTSAYITAAWNNDLQVTIKGYRDGTELYTRTLVVGPYSATKFDFNFDDIDTVTFHSEGGTNAGLEVSGEIAAQNTGESMTIITQENKILGAGTHFALDDIVINGGGDVVEPNLPSVANDLNGDGYSDILVGNTVNYNLTAWFGSEDATVSNELLTTLNAATEVVGKGDIDGDGYLDIIIRNSNSGALTALRGNEDGTVIATFLKTLTEYQEVLLLADMNGDGYDDILVKNTLNLRVNALLGNADASITNLYLKTLTAPQEIIEVLDVNGDGYDDIIVKNNNNRRVNAWLSDENANLSNQYLKTLPPVVEILRGLDFNNDGYDDLLVQNTVNRRVNVWLSNELANMTNHHLRTLPPAQDIVGVADINGDEFPDLIVSNRNNYRVNGWLNDSGTGIDNQYLKTLNAGATLIIDDNDINGDGYADMIVKNATGRVSAWLGSEDATLTNQYLKTLTASQEILD